jgi:hypothetical protein
VKPFSKHKSEFLFAVAFRRLLTVCVQHSTALSLSCRSLAGCARTVNQHHNGKKPKKTKKTEKNHQKKSSKKIFIKQKTS